MTQEQGPGALSVLLLILALFLLVSPLTRWWMSITPPWWFIYLIWLGLIGLTGWLAARVSQGEA